MEFDKALKKCREVRKDLDDMLASLRERAFYEIATEVGDVSLAGWGFDHMNDHLALLEKFILKEDLTSISDQEWEIYELTNFYDHLIEVMRRHKKTIKRTPLACEIIQWRKRAGEFAQMVCQMEDGD